MLSRIMTCSLFKQHMVHRHRMDIATTICVNACQSGHTRHCVRVRDKSLLRDSEKYLVEMNGYEWFSMQRKHGKGKKLLIALHIVQDNQSTEEEKLSQVNQELLTIMREADTNFATAIQLSGRAVLNKPDYCLHADLRDTHLPVRYHVSFWNSSTEFAEQISKGIFSASDSNHRYSLIQRTEECNKLFSCTSTGHQGTERPPPRCSLWNKSQLPPCFARCCCGC